MLDTPEFLRGRNGEQLVAELVMRRGGFVIPSYDYSGSDNKAPRMQGLRDSHILPDLDVSKRGTRVWIEVKTKAAASYTRITKRLEHGIHRRHWDEYRKVQQITGTPVWLVIYEEATGDVLAQAMDELDGCRREAKGMAPGGMVFFPRDAFKVIARGVA